MCRLHICMTEDTYIVQNCAQFSCYDLSLQISMIINQNWLLILVGIQGVVLFKVFCQVNTRFSWRCSIIIDFFPLPELFCCYRQHSLFFVWEKSFEQSGTYSTFLSCQDLKALFCCLFLTSRISCWISAFLNQRCLTVFILF